MKVNLVGASQKKYPLTASVKLNKNTYRGVKGQELWTILTIATRSVK